MYGGIWECIEVFGSLKKAYWSGIQVHRSVTRL